MNKKLLLSLVVWALAAVPAIAQETHTQVVTVFDGEATNGYVPLYGYYADAYLKCEYIVPADALTEVAGGTISSLAWYAGTPAQDSWGNANFQVFLREVSEATFSEAAYVGLDGATLVYEGPIDGTQSIVSVNFSTPFTYEGGNLLVGIYNTAAGSYKSITWLGVEATGASISGYSYSSLDAATCVQRNFGPKTSFEYIPGSGPVYNRPKDLAASEITSTSAKLTWEPGGNESSWEVAFKKKADQEWLVLGNFTETSCVLDQLDRATAYEARVRSMYPDGESGWVSVSFNTEVCDGDENKGLLYYELGDSYGDGWGANAIQVVYHNTGLVLETITLPSGSSASGAISLCYDEVYDLVWVAGSYGGECSFKVYYEGGVIAEHAAGSAPSAGTFANFEFSFVTCATPTDLKVDEVNWNNATLSWTPYIADQSVFKVAYSSNAQFDPDNGDTKYVDVEGATSVTLEDLNETTTYYVAVRAICGDEASNWSTPVSFKTPEQFPTPLYLQTLDLRALSTKLVWKGEAETYNIRYREAEKADPGEASFFEDFEGGAVPEGWTTIDADGDGYTWQSFTPSTPNDGAGNPFCFGNSCLISASYINNVGALNPDNYLVSPKLELSGRLSIYLRGIDPNYPAEHFAVYISTEGCESASDFTDVLIPETIANGVLTEYTFNLANFAGQTGYIAIRHFNVSDMFYLGLDNFALYEGEPSITPAGEWINIENVNDMYNSAWYCQHITDLTSKTAYEAQVQANYGNDKSEWSSILKFTTAADDTEPSGLEVSPVGDTYATASWSGVQEKFNLRYRTAAGITPGETTFSEEFEGGAIPEGWTLIDADGDGNNWASFTPNPNQDSANNPICFGSSCLTSESYINYVGALTPDNYLVTPQIDLGGTLSVYLRGLDPSYAAEHFAIYVSTEGNAAENFTTELVGETVATGLLTEYTADLSQYAGQKGYIAVRHFNVTDMYRLVVDNFFITNGTPIPAGEWNVVENITELGYKLTGLQNSTKYEIEVQGVIDEENTTEWSSPVEFTTLAKTYSLAEIIDGNIENQSVVLNTDLFIAAYTPSSSNRANPTAFLTDGEGHWAMTSSISATQLESYHSIGGNATAILTNVDECPTLTFSAGTLYVDGAEIDLREIDLEEEISELPELCEVAKVIGYFDGENLICANDPTLAGGDPGQTLKIDLSYGDFGLVAGNRYELTVGLIAPASSAGALRGDEEDQFLSKYLGIVTDAIAKPSGVEGVIDNNGNIVKDVRYYDINGRYIGKSINNASHGIYIGSDGSKTLKK